MSIPERGPFLGAVPVSGRARRVVRCEQHQGRECLTEEIATWLAESYGLQRLNCATTGSWHIRNPEIHRMDRSDARLPTTLRLVAVDRPLRSRRRPKN